MRLGQMIRERRQELGITAEELAIRAHVVETYISKMESKNILPSSSVILRISKALKKDFLPYYIKEKDPELLKALCVSFLRIGNALSKHSKKPSPSEIASFLSKNFNLK